MAELWWSSKPLQVLAIMDHDKDDKDDDQKRL